MTALMVMMWVVDDDDDGCDDDAAATRTRHEQPPPPHTFIRSCSCMHLQLHPHAIVPTARPTQLLRPTFGQPRAPCRARTPSQMTRGISCTRTRPRHRRHQRGGASLGSTWTACSTIPPSPFWGWWPSSQCRPHHHHHQQQHRCRYRPHRRPPRRHRRCHPRCEPEDVSALQR